MQEKKIIVTIDQNSKAEKLQSLFLERKMGTKKYKPTTPGQRSRQINDYEAITTTKKEKVF